MRNFLSKEDYPVLFASTYETHKFVKDPAPDEPQIKEKKKVLIGYKE